MIQNKIAVAIPDADYAQAVQLLNDLETLLTPYLIALTPDERRKIPKAGDKTTPFVEKALEYAAQKPALKPGFIDLTEWEKDNKARIQVSKLLRICEQLASNMDDTAMTCGSDAYTSALGFYNNIKQASKMNVPDAKSIQEDLSRRFPGRIRSKSKPPLN